MAETTAPAKKKISVFAIIAIIVALLITTLIVIKLVKEHRNKKRLEAEKKKQTGETDTRTSEQKIIDKIKSKDSAGFPLEKGDKGFNVKMLQGYINKIAKYEQPGKFEPLAEDGDFGTKTKDRLTAVISGNYYPVSKENFNKIAERAANLGYQTNAT